MIKEDLIADLDYLESCLDEARNAILKVIELADSKGLIQEDCEQWQADNGFGRNLAEEVVEGFDHLEKKRSREEFLEDLYSWANKPYKWVGLTDEEVQDAIKFPYHAIPFARAIEAKLKEKNT